MLPCSGVETARQTIGRPERSVYPKGHPEEWPRLPPATCFLVQSLSTLHMEPSRGARWGR